MDVFLDLYFFHLAYVCTIVDMFTFIWKTLISKTFHFLWHCGQKLACVFKNLIFKIFSFLFFQSNKKIDFFCRLCERFFQMSFIGTRCCTVGIAAPTPPMRYAAYDSNRLGAVGELPCILALWAHRFALWRTRPRKIRATVDCMHVPPAADALVPIFSFSCLFPSFFKTFTADSCPHGSLRRLWCCFPERLGGFTSPAIMSQWIKVNPI